MQMNEMPSIGTTLTYGEAIKAYDRFERTMLENASGPSSCPRWGCTTCSGSLSRSRRSSESRARGLPEAQEGDPIVLEREDRSGERGERREVLPAAG